MKNRNTITIFTTILLACFGFLPRAQPVVPAPDGGYPGGNTAEGQNALFSLANGVHNTAIGYLCLRNTTTGSYNTALGSGTLLANTADGNTATGVFALISNTIGGLNTANGALALFSNTEGGNNTANGFRALFSNTEGDGNTATGFEALERNTTGQSNTATGYQALWSNTVGYFNTALGFNAMSGFPAFVPITGNANTVVGAFAGNNIVTGFGNTYIGQSVVNPLLLDESNTTRIADNLPVAPGSKCFIGGIAGQLQNFAAGVNDYVTVRLADGRLGHTAVVSSRRYKEDIKPLAAVSEALYALKPVSFRLKKQYDETQELGFGLIAEEVEKVDPALVYRNNKGQAESVHYEMVNAMLLNEFLKEHKKVEEQEATITKLKATAAEQEARATKQEAATAQQQKQIEVLTAGLQKVSAQVEMGRPAPRVVVKNQ